MPTSQLNLDDLQVESFATQDDPSLVYLDGGTWNDATAGCCAPPGGTWNDATAGCCAPPPPSPGPKSDWDCGATVTITIAISDLWC